MTRMMNRMSDRLLSRLLRRDIAGACVPDHGESCGAPTYVCRSGRLYRTTYGTVACNGSCPTPITQSYGTC